MRDQRLKILYLVHRAPYPPNRGDRIRSYHLLKFLAARSEVYLACLSEQPLPRESVQALEKHCALVVPAELGSKTRWVKAAWSLAAGRTATEGLFRSAALARAVGRLARQTRFDAVVVFCSSMVQYLNLAGLEGVPVVVDLVDVDSQKWFDYAEKARGLKRWLFELEGRRLRRLEGSLPERVKAITLVSDSEADLYRGFCPADCVRPIGNGVDLEHFRPAGSFDSSESRQCVFVGALDYRANVDGVSWFCRHVWPEVHRRRPEATFLLVGGSPTAAVRRLAEGPGVELVGEVPDVRPYLAAAAVVVTPLRIARGVQNKVLEALAMGKALIGSPESLHGLAVEPGMHVRQAATPGEWIEAITELLDGPELRDRLGRAGRARVEERYCWRASLEPFAALLGLPDRISNIEQGMSKDE